MIETVIDLESELTDEFVAEIQSEHDPERPFMAFNRKHFVATWMGLIKQGFGTVWALREGGRLKGAIGAMIAPEPNDGKKVASLAFWFVRKADSGSFDSTRLFLTFELWAARQKVDRIVCAVCYDTLGGEQEAFLSARGYDIYETRYYKELSWEQKPS